MPISEWHISQAYSCVEGHVQYGELQDQPHNTEVKPMVELLRKEDFYEQVGAF